MSMKIIPWQSYSDYSKCKCPEIIAMKKKRKPNSNRTGLSEGKPLSYPINENGEIVITKLCEKTFLINYEEILSFEAKCILNSFQNKYIYYAIDDILYLLDSKPKERKNLMALLHSSMQSLHNNLSINFFDIWIKSIYINDTYKENRFLIKDSKNQKQVTHITLNLSYITRTPTKKVEPIW